MTEPRRYGGKTAEELLQATPIRRDLDWDYATPFVILKDAIPDLLDHIAEMGAEVERLSAHVAGNWKNTRLLRAGPGHDGWGLEMQGGPIPFIAEYLAEMLGYKSDDGKPINYVAMEVNHHSFGAMELTLQRVGGLTPAQKAGQLASQVTELESANARQAEVMKKMAEALTAVYSGSGHASDVFPLAHAAISAYHSLTSTEASRDD